MSMAREEMTTIELEAETVGEVPAPVTESSRPTSIELFAGAGGLALGVERAGFRTLATVERDRWACDTIRENAAAGHELVSAWTVIESDVREHDWSRYGDDVALVSGGPPCQPFSMGGRGLAAEDPRDMFPATADVLAAVRPRAFIIENVRGLTRPSLALYYEYVRLRLSMPEMRPRRNETWPEHLERMRRSSERGGGSLRYRVTPTLLDAADYGVPQRRHRVFMVGFREDIDVDWSFPRVTHSQLALIRDQWVTGDYWERNGVSKQKRPEAPSASVIRRAAGEHPPLRPWVTVREALQGLPEPGSRAARSIPNHVYQAGARSYTGHTGSPLDQPSKALKAGGHGVPGGENMVLRPDGSVRYFTVRESARLQTFPEDYVLHGSWGEAMRQLGNAVPVDLARVVAQGVHDAIVNGTNRSAGGRA
ncbi:DNA cytosine methyltransferase [Actinotalea ferrariae]|nr:DNA cytosine methyltransferase [Actinotalea ferrariae]